MNTIEELMQVAKPKEGYIVYTFKSKETNNFVAIIYKKLEVSARYAKTKEYTGGAEKVISEKEFEKYLNALKPYIAKRTKDAQEPPKALPESTV